LWNNATQRIQSHHNTRKTSTTTTRKSRPRKHKHPKTNRKTTKPEAKMMQTTQETPNTPPAPPQITKLLTLHGIKTSKRSYITRAAKALPTLTKPFTVPVLARRAGIPRSKGYPTIKQLQKLRLVKPVQKTLRPPDWNEYTRSMRKRFNRQHGLPTRGIEPQRYQYTPREALLYLRETISKQIQQVDQHALNRITTLTQEYSVIEDALSSHQR